MSYDDFKVRLLYLLEV